MSSKLQHCCKYVFIFKCLNPNDNKKHSPVKKTARGDSYRLLIAHWVQKTRGMLPSHSLSLHVGFYSSSLVSQCCLYWSFVHWTWTFLRGAVKTKPDVNTIGVICMAAATSPRHVQGPESQHVHRAGDFLVQLGHQSGEDVESKGLSQSPCRGWYKYFIRPLRWFLNKLMDDKCIQISRKLWSRQTALKSFSESNDQRDRPAGPQISFEDQPHHFPVALFTPCHQNKTATKKGSLSLFICCHQSVRKMDGFWRWFQSSALRVQLKTHSRCWKHTAQEFIHSAGAKLD